MPNSSVPGGFGACAAAIPGPNRTANKPAQIAFFMMLPLSVSFRSHDLSRLHVDKYVLLAFRRLDLDHVDFLALLFLNRYFGDFAGDALKGDLRRLLLRDLRPGRRP